MGHDLHRPQRRRGHDHLRLLRGHHPLSEGATRSLRSPPASVVGLSLVGLLALGPALPLFGCTVSENFDPTGGDIAVSATWTVQGAAATTTSCQDAGIEVVELRVWEQYEGGDHYTEDEWIVQCAAGSVTTQPILVPGTYRVGIYGSAVMRDEEDGAVVEGDAGFPPNTGGVEAAALVEVSAEAGGTLSVSLDLSPEMSE